MAQGQNNKGGKREQQSRTGDPDLKERLVGINRVAKTTKGGRTFSFGATMVVGDEKGRVGHGLGKSREVATAIQKGIDNAKKDMIKVPVINGTIPHRQEAKFAGAHVLIRPASPGTGIIAGAPVRAVMEQAGVQNILTKRQGSKNAMNLVHATMEGLISLKDAVSVANKRGLTIGEVFN